MQGRAEKFSALLCIDIQNGKIIITTMVVIKIKINNYASVYLAGSGYQWRLSDNKFYLLTSLFFLTSQPLSAPIAGSASRVQINSNVIAFNFAKIPP